MIKFLAYYLSKIHRPNNRGLAHAQSGDESTSVDSAQVAMSAHEDGDADNPQYAQLPRCPDAADTVADEECTGIESLANSIVL